jgi:hypothetical protein
MELCLSTGPTALCSPRIRPTVQRLPTIDQWNVSLQRQLTPTLNVTVAYVGNKGTHVFAGTWPFLQQQRAGYRERYIRL